MNALSRPRSLRPFASLLLCAAIAALSLGQSRPTPGTAATSPSGDTTLFGSTEPVAKVDVPAALRGILLEVNVKEGQAIKKDDQLAKLDDALQSQQVEFARLKAEQASLIQGAQNQIDYAKNASETIKGRGSPSEVREKELAYKQSLLSLEVQLDEQRQNKVKLRQEQITLDHMVLRSPIDGFVLRIHKQPGEQTDEGPVITVVQTSKLNAVFFLPKQLFGKVTVGNKVNLDFEGLLREGHVVAVDPTLDAGLFRVKLEVDNADTKIPAGGSVMWLWKK